MSRPVYVYFLLDPRVTGPASCRYVGKSVNPKKRFGAHVHQSRTGKTHKCNWVRSVLHAGEEPVLLVVEECGTDKEASMREAFWISELRRFDALTNATEGGEGVAGWEASKETRRRMSLARQGQKHSEETKAKRSAAHTGPLNPMYGRFPDEPMRKRLSDSHRRENLSAETLRRMSLSHKGILAGEKHPMWGRNHTLETREKMRGRSAGTRNPKAKLTWEDVREIRRLSAGGASRVSLARAYAVDHSTISDIALGITWKE